MYNMLMGHNNISGITFLDAIVMVVLFNKQ